MSGIFIQILVSFLFSVPAFMASFANSWTSYTLLLLESDASPLGYRITNNDGSLIGSVTMLGSMLALMVATYVSDKIGRKRTEILCGLCNALGWSIITTAKSVTQLLIARIIMGIGTGLHSVAAPVFISEISQTSIRGTLLSIMAFMYSTGSLVSYIEGWFCSYDVINYLNLTLAISYVVILSFVNETPVYLLTLGKEKEAINSLKLYRGARTVTKEILDEIVSIRSLLANNIYLKIRQLEHENEKLNDEKVVVQAQFDDIAVNEQNVWSILRSAKSTQRALIILVLNQCMGIFLGMSAVQAYAGQFFIEAAPSLSPHVCSVILAGIIMIISGLAVVIVDLVPRRFLMMTTCLTCTGCMACLATMVRWAWAPEWGIPLFMVLFSISFTLGVTNVTYVQISECLPPTMNSFGTTVVMCFMYLAGFVVLFIFKPAVDTFGLEGVFLIFAIIGLLTATITFLLMRETRGVPYEIVKNSFERGFLYRKQKYELNNL